MKELLAAAKAVLDAIVIVLCAVPAGALQDRMTRTFVLFVLMLSASTAFAQAASAPAGGMPPGHGAGQPQIPPQQQQQLMMAQMQLMQAEQKAMKDPVIAAERQKIRELIEGEMLKADPKLKPTMTRFHELEGEAKKMQAQQAAGTLDMEKARALMKEMGEIGAKLEKAQMAVMKLPKIEKATKAFEKRLEAKMIEIDPNVGAARKLLESMDPRRGGPAR